MSYKPLVIDQTTDPGQIQQLQGGAELDIPLNDQVRRLHRTLLLLVTWMVEEEFELPEEIIEQLNES